MNVHVLSWIFMANFDWVPIWKTLKALKPWIHIRVYYYFFWGGGFGVFLVFGVLVDSGFPGYMAFSRYLGFSGYQGFPEGIQVFLQGSKGFQDLKWGYCPKLPIWPTVNYWKATQGQLKALILFPKGSDILWLHVLSYVSYLGSTSIFTLTVWYEPL